MKSKFLSLIVFVLLTASCHKGRTDPPLDPPPVVFPPDDPTAIIFDTTTVRLKDMVLRNLPSPYYHFEYNDSGYVTLIDHASGARVYTHSYAGKRIAEMANDNFVNKDKIKYEYLDNKVVVINIADSNGIIYQRCFLFFSLSRKLMRLEWEIKEGNVFVPQQTVSLTYYPDGNLKDLTTHFFRMTGQPEMTFKDTYENYDNRIGVEGFSLLHNYQRHLIFIPSLKIQLNNARRITRTGDGTNFKVDYVFAYDGKSRPVVKNGDFVYTNGTEAGRHVQIQSSFSYYD